jgi:hypothetical protein
MVAEQNELAARVADLIYIAARRGVYVIIEQPSPSVLWYHPRVAKVLERFSFKAVATQLGAFGGDTVKPINLRFTVPWGEKLRKTMTKSARGVVKERNKATTTARRNNAGKVRVDGVRQHLKASQAYPLGFGNAVGMLMREHNETDDDIELDDFWLHDAGAESSEDES